MEEKENNNLQGIKKYFGLENDDDVRKVKWILDELETYGDWGSKVSTYFSSILSGHDGERTFIPSNQVEAYKSLFIDLQDKSE